MSSREGYRIIDKDEEPLHGPAEKREGILGVETVVEDNGELAVTHNSQLKYFHYLKVEPGFDNVRFEMYIADEAKAITQKIGWKRLRDALEEELRTIEKNPQGEKSIDPDKNNDQAQQQRSVNRLGAEFEEVVGTPIAIKGTGKQSISSNNRENLARQFIRMRTLEAEMRQALTKEQQEVFKACKVFALISYAADYPKGEQEWLIMERVPEAQWVKDVRYGSGSNEFDIGFDPEEHPGLAHLFGEAEVKTWQGLKQEFENRGIVLPDFNKRNIFGFTGTGRNVLWNSGQDDKKVYTLIDQ